MTDERRSHERFEARLRVKWDGISGLQEARLDDISLGGCFVNTRTRVDIGELITLEIELADGDWLPLPGEVTSFQPGIGFGLAFVLVTDEDEFILRDLLG